MPDSISRDELRRAARDWFGLQTLRAGQLECMEAAVRGSDVLAVMPTGSGKSAIYQVPGAMLPGTTVVVSPLVALQRDQVEAINHDLGAQRAFAINSQLGARAERQVWAAVTGGDAKFVFLAPEQLAREETLARLAGCRISLFVVDEAHCISSWGHDFRPDYLTLTAAIAQLGRPPVAALTATASPHVRAEVVERLGMRDPHTVVHSFDRPNLSLEVVRHHEDRGKRLAVLDQAAQLRGPGLLYAATRKDTEWYAAELAGRGLRADAYHAGRRAADRARIHRQFLGNDLDVVVATTAFGMGIDKPDVRFVVHADIPASLDSYYQEIGRSGRDGEPARAVLHYRSEDLGLQQFFAGHAPAAEDLAAVFAAVQESGPLRAAALSRESGLSTRRQARVLNLLEHSGSILAGRRGYRAVKSADAEGAVERALAEAESRQRIDKSRVEMMRGYAETDHCRRDFLLNYFGEETSGYCGTCDNCEHGSAAEARALEESLPEGYAVQTPVRHREWGAGTVMGVMPDRITVLFESVGYKDLSLKLIEEDAGLLEVGRIPEGS
ncbi:RecQ family ATP-dependent DNA helicase [Arthrobacter mobilis]|uniref:ATP-dependent DNA helicase RecQ n=1 Tax=Arthrobacter mobilis TaxID=2724944 RepID=A0A7X6QMC8_9MICC|nr:ATP-dependent DNA helicase RecQ [Arthrobacter mobilis]NKX56641.1 RecQ family ATP-dependent DNA helicase [Arthrobacter mobilis]